MSMHPDFPRWYRSVSLGEDPEKLSKRWKGVESVLNAASFADVEGLLGILLRRSDVEGAFIGRFRQYFTQFDPFFGSSDNAREVEVLSGCALMVLMERRDDIGYYSALSVLTSSVERTFPLDFDLVAKAEQEVRAYSTERRRRGPLEAPEIDADAAFAEFLEDFQPTAELNNLKDSLSTVADQVAKRLEEFGQQVADAWEPVVDRILAQEEETQILWWLVGKWSETYGKPFAEIPAATLPLALGRDLADLTKLIPGLEPCDGFLGQAGLSSKKMLSVPSMVNASDGQWLGTFDASTDYSAVTTPLHLAITWRLKTNGKGWEEAWSASTAIDPSQKLSALELGRSFYRERVLLEIQRRGLR